MPSMRPRSFALGASHTSPLNIFFPFIFSPLRSLTKDLKFSKMAFWIDFSRFTSLAFSGWKGSSILFSSPAVYTLLSIPYLDISSEKPKLAEITPMEPIIEFISE